MPFVGGKECKSLENSFLLYTEHSVKLHIRSGRSNVCGLHNIALRVCFCQEVACPQIEKGYPSLLCSLLKLADHFVIYFYGTYATLCLKQWVMLNKQFLQKKGKKDEKIINKNQQVSIRIHKINMGVCLR